MKIGIGYDIHRLVEGRRLFLGGVEVPFKKGLLGHSDADVLLHAICDALLGAAGLGDIGEHFPDTDKRYKDISSRELLKKVYSLIRKNGYTIGNIDTVVIAQRPRLAPFKCKMQKKIAEILKVKEEIVSVKAKTNEGLQQIGKGEAIASYAVVLVDKK